MPAPGMAGWNLALRFGLELAALVGLAMGAWEVSSGWVRWVAVILVPLTATVVWGVFNVVGDPSRSGKAAVEVPVRVRLGIEFLVFAGGAGGFNLSGRPIAALVFVFLVLTHYAFSIARIRWILDN